MTQDPWEAIRQISSQECPECGAEITRSDSSCPSCGAALAPAEEEAEPALNVMAGGEAGKGGAHPKVPLENARNLRRLREARDGILDGSMSAETYKSTVAEILHVAHLGAEIFKTPAVKTKVATLPPDEAELVARTEAEMKALHRAVGQMARFSESGDRGDVEEGFREAEAAYTRMDALQDQALEKSGRYE